MSNLIYWVTFFIFGVWGLAGALTSVDLIQKNEIGLAITGAFIAVIPLALLIFKKPWIKTKWNKIFGSLNNATSSEGRDERNSRKAEAKDQRNSEKAFYCMQMLTYVAISDKSFGNADKEIIVNFIRNIFSESQAVEAIRMLDEWGSTAKLAELNLNETLAKINQLCSRDERRKIVEACKMLIRTDGHIDETETSVFGLIRRAIYPTELGGLFSTKCGNCKSDNCETVSKKEIDRWVARKEVTERLASGKTRTKNVAITKIKIQYQWVCKDCMNQWIATETLEKN